MDATSDECQVCVGSMQDGRSGQVRFRAESIQDRDAGGVLMESVELGGGVGSVCFVLSFL